MMVAELIEKRPKEVYKRAELGHWEGDTVESSRIDHKRKSAVCFVALTERKSRTYIAIKVPNRTAAVVTPSIINALKDFPDDLVKTTAFDRGKEFSGYKKIEEKLNCNTYFCDPYLRLAKRDKQKCKRIIKRILSKRYGFLTNR